VSHSVVILTVVASPAATLVLLAGHQNTSSFAAQDPEQSALGFFENLDLHFILPRTHAQQGFVDRFFHGLSLAFVFVGHAV
jgi:hypothetical protein